MDNINFSLSKDEALVFFDFLSRINEKDHGSLVVDQAESRILWDLECILEKVLVEPLSPNYDKLIEEARSKVRDEG